MMNCDVHMGMIRILCGELPYAFTKRVAAHLTEVVDLAAHWTVDQNRAVYLAVHQSAKWFVDSNRAVERESPHPELELYLYGVVR